MEWIHGETGGRELAEELVVRWARRWDVNGVGPFAVLADGVVVGRTGCSSGTSGRGRPRSSPMPETTPSSSSAGRSRARTGVTAMRQKRPAACASGPTPSADRAADLADRPRERPLDPRRRQARRAAGAARPDVPRPGGRLAAPAAACRPIALVRYISSMGVTPMPGSLETEGMSALAARAEFRADSTCSVRATGRHTTVTKVAQLRLGGYPRHGFVTARDLPGRDSPRACGRAGTRAIRRWR